jgi:predicted ArsR family transcriptional regulator
MPEDFAADVAGVAALDEPVRRELYRYVVAQDAPVSRDEAAAGTGVARHVAKFNLERLVDQGLLDIEFRRPPGRGGPGAGRPAKVYRRAAREISVSLPERRYDLAGRLLAEAVTVAGRDGIAVEEALHAAARATGGRLGRDAGTPGEGTSSLGTVSDVLARIGYEPRATGPGLVLANCPFHSLAADYTTLVCGMNLDLVQGLLDALRPGELSAKLDPAPGRCCVTLEPAGTAPVAG